MNSTHPRPEFHRTLPYFTGSKTISIYNARDIDRVLVSPLNAIRKWEVRFGTIPQVIIGDSKTLLILPRPTVAPAAGSAVKMFKITSLVDTACDYVTAREWDGTNLGTTDINIAKPVHVRPSLAKEVIDGTTFNYTLCLNNSRTSSDGTNTQTEVCYPRYIVKSNDPTLPTQGIIYAAKVANGTGVTDADDQPVQWIETGTRVFARKYIQ